MPDIIYFYSYIRCFYYNFIEDKQYLLFNNFCGTINKFTDSGNLIKSVMINNNNIIELPYYWVDLVHEDSITINLTSIGTPQDLYVVSANNKEIIIKNSKEENIDCYYVVYGERKDIDKLMTEYIRE